MDLDGAAFESKAETARKLPTGVEEPHTYGKRNWAFIPNYGERYRNGERIATGFVESAVNQVISKRMVKHQQMGWSQRRISAKGGGQERRITPRNLLLSAIRLKMPIAPKR